MLVLVVGATGKFAHLVVPELKKRGARVRALIRGKDREAKAREYGVDEVVVGDLEDPSSLRSAAKGVEGVFHLNPAFAPNEARLGTAMVEVARSSGVKKFVFSGVIHPSLSKMIGHAAKQPVEEAIYDSGLNFVILQPAMFMQNLGNAWNVILTTGQFALPYSKQSKTCYVDYRDVAEAAALGLTGDSLDYGTFELSSHGLSSRAEIAHLISEVLGRKVEATEVSFEKWVQAAQIPEGPMRQGIKAMFEHYDRIGLAGGNGLVLRSILGREPRTLPQYIRELATTQKMAA